MFKQFDPGKITMVWNGIQILGIGPDTFVKAVRNEDQYTEQVGANGDVVHSRNRNRTGKVTFTIQDASPTNDALSAAAKADELTGLMYGALLIKDLNGTTLIQCANARIQKFPDLEYGKDSGTNEWILMCAELEMYIGGGLV
ncbi:MAG: DUF3277 family protein [Actinobacteria bacterium]|nr:DUF3277 family protein [Actinomycetota bacterium]